MSLTALCSSSFGENNIKCLDRQQLRAICRKKPTKTLDLNTKVKKKKNMDRGIGCYRLKGTHVYQIVDNVVHLKLWFT